MQIITARNRNIAKLPINSFCWTHA